MGYNAKFKLRVLKHYWQTKTPLTHVAKIRKVPRMTLYRWLNQYRLNGLAGLNNKPTGSPEIVINSKFCEKIIHLWNKRQRGVHKMWIDLKFEGFHVSERQIQKLYNLNRFKMNKRKRPSQLKFVKYEWPKPNLLWHTDWTTCPFTGKQLIAFIDDHSRFIVHAEYFEHATTENTLLAFANAISKYGYPEAILTDNGSQFTPARGIEGPFTQFCKERNIKHILGRVHHPQTNGKIERWFGTYKQEFKEEQDTLNTFIKFYNYERRHQGINYAIPYERYEKCNINAV